MNITASIKEFQLLEKTVGGIAKTAEFASSYLQKLLIISLITSTLITAIVYDWINGFGLTFVICLAIAFLPTLLLIYLKNQLSDVIELPERFMEVKEHAASISEKLKESGVMNSFNDATLQENAELKRRVFSLISIAPTLYKLKDELSELINPELFFSIQAVANPLFGTMITMIVIPVGLWSFTSIIMSLIWLFS